MLQGKIQLKSVIDCLKAGKVFCPVLVETAYILILAMRIRLPTSSCNIKSGLAPKQTNFRLQTNPKARQLMHKEKKRAQ